ncbi:alpha-galactosidase, partial [Streptomyces sp. NRRL B-24572]|uniref:alpha-galactosidase n=1 Tax=Streptomyces sp. NRRL B-24572 TaxID=1962156 RepID=UPI000A3D44EB
MPVASPPVTFDPDLGLAVLRTPNTMYALRIGADGSPRHLYWGAPLDHEDLAAMPDPTSPVWGIFESEAAADELAPQTGARFGPAGLQVRFSDGTRGTQWRYTGYAVDGSVLRIRLDDRRRPLRTELCYRVLSGGDVIERWTELTHTGSVDGPPDPVTVDRLDSASWTAPPLADYRLSHLTGTWSSESRLQRDRLAVAETVLTSRRGITSHHANPWLALDNGTAAEEHGEVWSTALAWSGSWRVTIHRDPLGRTTWTDGFGHEGLSWTLRAGETLQTPVYAGLYTPHGFGAASRAWHEHVRRHVLPEPERDLPVLYNSWEATAFDVDEAGQIHLARLAARLGTELFVLDDGWFGARRDAKSGLGDWTPRPDAFPRGLRPLADEVHGLGMEFGLWVEPEMVNRDSDLYRAHPDWVVHSPRLDATEFRSQLVLNFARPQVEAWAQETLDRLVRENRVDWLKWDANRPFTDVGWEGHPDPDRLWIDHTRAVHRIMDRLRAAHPGLRIEACAGGGGRVDLGMLARTDQAWTSDNTDPVDRI